MTEHRSMPAHGRFVDVGPRVEENPKWIRGFVGDTLVVDSRETCFIWETKYYPQWYFPTEAFNAELRRSSNTPSPSAPVFDHLGTPTMHDLVVDGTVLDGAAWVYEDSPVEAIRDRVRVDFAALDRWTEEDVEVIVHPRSPYVRIDILASSRRVVVSLGGQVLAESTNTSILYESGLPPRFYMPIDDVVAGVLSPTDTSSACPYKGVARYWDVTVADVVHHDLVWGYDAPLPESAAVKDLVCFYNEKVEIEIDGVALASPRTRFS